MALTRCGVCKGVAQEYRIVQELKSKPDFLTIVCGRCLEHGR